MGLFLKFLPIIIYILLAILLVVLIVLGLKLINTVDKTNAVLDEIEKKSKSLDGIFGAIDNVTDTISFVSDKLVESIASVIGKALRFRKKSKKKEEEDYE